MRLREIGRERDEDLRRARDSADEEGDDFKDDEAPCESEAEGECCGEECEEKDEGASADKITQGRNKEETGSIAEATSACEDVNMAET